VNSTNVLDEGMVSQTRSFVFGLHCKIRARSTRSAVANFTGVLPDAMVEHACHACHAYLDWPGRNDSPPGMVIGTRRLILWVIPSSLFTPVPVND
jgi:hypothetical protein